MKRYRGKVKHMIKKRKLLVYKTKRLKEKQINVREELRGQPALKEDGAFVGLKKIPNLLFPTL